jgi:hypothetical protein
LGLAAIAGPETSATAATMTPAPKTSLRPEAPARANKPLVSFGTWISPGLPN